MKSLVLAAIVATVFSATTYAEALDISLKSARYQANESQTPGAPKGTITVTGVATNSGSSGCPFSAQSLAFRILEELPNECWKQVSPEYRYKRGGPEGAADALLLEPGQRHTFEIEIAELTRGLPDGKEFQIIVWNDDGMAAIPFSKKPDTE